ncbi:putative Derlin-3 [Hibiscus syriacus]|uniref:Derlin-3 n=1 Tax=Hibiscus syriacus TaxID=106335 RepID=A0A6A3BE12_HIBSY|nr:putative Derlin-3 [Hibiscus syriacus]
MGHTCGVSSGKLVGRVQVTMDLGLSQIRPSVFQNGWMKLGSESEKTTAKLHLTVKTEPDPRFVFQFGGEPECSPVVFQIQGNIRQPVFSCKFSADRSRSRSLPQDFSNKNRGWMRTFSGEKERQGRERKGWMIMIHDLSGSPVAAASMITPFVPSPGSDRVSRSNPGAWLILRPNGFSIRSWKPWGRLEAWRERGPIDGLGYKFELVTENSSNNGIPIAEATMSVKKGGQFCIDKRVSSNSFAMSFRSPVKGFVVGATVEGEGKISKSVVQVGMQHVTCMADAALFISLSALIDLSMDACQLFSSKLRKELCHDYDNDSFFLNPI